jgi:hypothetical protein
LLKFEEWNTHIRSFGKIRQGKVITK